MKWLSGFVWEVSEDELQARFDARVLEVGVDQATTEVDQALGWSER